MWKEPGDVKEKLKGRKSQREKRHSRQLWRGKDDFYDDDCDDFYDIDNYGDDSINDFADCVLKGDRGQLWRDQPQTGRRTE